MHAWGGCGYGLEAHRWSCFTLLSSRLLHYPLDAHSYWGIASNQVCYMSMQTGAQVSLKCAGVGDLWYHSCAPSQTMSKQLKMYSGVLLLSDSQSSNCLLWRLQLNVNLLFSLQLWICIPFVSGRDDWRERKADRSTEHWCTVDRWAARMID